MLYVGLDLSRKRLDFDARLASGELFERGAVPPDADGLAGLVRRLGDAEVLEVLEVIESMNGARFVHDRLEHAGWEVRIADALKAKGRVAVDDGGQPRPDRHARRAPTPASASCAASAPTTRTCDG